MYLFDCRIDQETGEQIMDRRLCVILVLLLASGIALSIAAHIFGIFRFDMEVDLALKGNESPVIAAVMSVVSFLGDGWAPAILAFAVSATCAIRKKWLEALLVVATLTSVILSWILKVLVGRPRPSTFPMNPSDVFQSFNQYAYPSGHVLFFVVFFGFVAFLAWKHLAGWMRGVTISICGTLIVLTGPSRIYLGEHWVSDVIGSYIIGASWLIILILLYLVVIHKRNGG
jgi:undecaprenyl-diphosphatase